MTDTVTRLHDPLHEEFEAQEDIGAQNLETTEFEVLAEKAMSRRGFLRGSTALDLSAFVLGTTSLTTPAAASRFGFEAVPTSTADTVIVPEGYSWQVLVRWGDPLWSKGKAFDQNSRGTATSQALSFGDNNDGMALFAHGDKSVLAVNNEYINRAHIFGNEDGKPMDDDADKIPADLKRYGVKEKDRGYGWSTVDERFDVAKHPTEPNRFGYIVEIDPLDPTSTPKKRTALGRFKHENAELVIANNGQAVVYMGDDERGEFIYKFVSTGKYVLGGDNSDLLEDGKLYAAKFHDDGTGEWRELSPQTTGMASQAEICIMTRQAASAVGATTMDRPEWIAAHPSRAEVCCTLTNNKNRGVKTNAGGDLTPVGGPNPRAKNNYGQIVSWRPANEDHTSNAFDWDLFVVAGNPTVHDDAYAGSSNINAGNMFNSPDGLMFDSTGLLWIQTDGNYSNEKDFAGMGNNQMLVGDPDTGEIRRFMTGPKECEITGITWSLDRRTVFVGIQHPGERGDSHFPDGGNTVPRSAIVAVTRDDGGLIG